MEAGAGSGPPGRGAGSGLAGSREGAPGAGASRLLCWFGRHVPDATVVWHGGYGFAHCRRCHRAIVRSLLSNWVVPGPGLRIVWPGEGRATGSEAPAAVRAEPSRETPVVAEPGSAREPLAPNSPADAGGGRDEMAAAPLKAADQTDDAVLDLDEAAIPVIVRFKANVDAAGNPGPDAPLHVAAEPPVTTGTAQPRLIPPVPPPPEPIDLLGPHFMGDMGAPPGPRDGLDVFVFDDMADDERRTGSVGAQRAS